jgi:hypothetical protein
LTLSSLVDLNDYASTVQNEPETNMENSPSSREGTHVRKHLRKLLFAIPVVGVLLVSGCATILFTNFENFALGSVDGQHGWSATGTSYDQAIVDNTYGYASFGSKSLRVSNAVASGSFGDWIFAAPVADGAGETIATANGFPEGNRTTHFEVEFDIASTVPDAEQPDLGVSMSPDRGDGSRMSYLKFLDTPGGIDVEFYDVQGTDNPANFVSTIVASGLDRSVPHHVRLVMDFNDGPSNDVVSVYIDGNLVHTGTSWENYYRYDSEASAEPTPRVVRTIIIQARGTSYPANAGNGFLFDNLQLTSGTQLPTLN